MSETEDKGVYPAGDNELDIIRKMFKWEGPKESLHSPLRLSNAASRLLSRINKTTEEMDLQIEKGVELKGAGNKSNRYVVKKIGMTSIPKIKIDRFVPRYTRESLIILSDLAMPSIRTGGKISKSLFVPSLTFLAVKKIFCRSTLNLKLLASEINILYTWLVECVRSL